MNKNGFVRASEMGADKVIPFSDYSFSFSLSRYSKLDGVRKGFQILMHACPGMLILPADDEELQLEALECAGDIPKEVKIGKNIFLTQQRHPGKNTASSTNRSKLTRQ
jgi:hypothetical protein